MAQVEQAPESRDTVKAELTYAAHADQNPLAESSEVGGRIEYRGGDFVQQEVTIHNGREAAEPFSLEQHGFQLMKHASAMTDFRDQDEIRAVYYPEMERLIKEVSGASRIHMFDHTLRAGDDVSDDAKWMRETVKNAHNDYTNWSGPQRVHDLLPDEAEELLQHRFAVIQVWRPVRSPLERQPLAICDARTIAEHDLVKMERRRPDRIGETYQLVYSPNQHWVYFPMMTDEEALMFKTYESEREGRSRFTAHASFEDPTVWPDAPGRVSIEVRAFAFFGPA